ncbi:hypothetical protein MLD38_028457 [Melastoma candidum]|uniref:Uncharacterized protein n=1 Tax=Melastoma candidum TaxID=119954 RepID=A0ACB9N3G0_9MYRT|nr:hypothetical protein MLD38_028457 [Melastoma candidum]
MVAALPFRMLCRMYGARAAYFLMLHSRIATKDEKYRLQEFTCYTTMLRLVALWFLIEIGLGSRCSTQAVKNGNIRHMKDVTDCLAETGYEGMLSAESLLENLALFASYLTAKWVVIDEEGSSREGCIQEELNAQSQLTFDFLYDMVDWLRSKGL